MAPPHSARGHAHRRTASREMSFVLDFADSGSMNPFPGLGSGVGNMENVIPPRPNTKQETEVELNQTPVDSQKPGVKAAKLTVSKDLSKPMATPVESPDREHAEAVEDESIQMTLVSPPFSPSAAEVDFVTGGSRSKSNDEKIAPLDLTNEDTKRVQSHLEEELPNVFCESRARIPTTNGTEIFLHVYRNDIDLKEHLAIVFGNDIRSKSLFAPRAGETEHDRMTRGAYTGTLFPGRENSMEDEDAEAKNAPQREADVLCRIHSECYTGETAWSARCDCGEQLDEAARLMAEDGHGVIVYLRQEGRGIGLGEKLKAYNLQDLGADTVQANLMLRHPADGRSFGLATAILKDLGLDHIRLMTNNPDKIVAVEGKHHEIKVTQRVPMIPLSWQNKGGFQSKEVDKYLSTKIERMGHLLDH